jgi:hypothetical protein
MSARQDRLDKQKQLWANVSWEEIETFIGQNAGSYKKTWEKNYADIQQKGYPGIGLSWHWPALIPIWGIPWAVARRQWSFVGVLVGAVVLITVFSFFMESANFGFMTFLIPIMAKPFYIQMAVAKISKLKEKFADPAAQKEAIRGAGGLDMTSGYIAGGICLILQALAIWSIFMG